MQSFAYNSDRWVYLTTIRKKKSIVTTKIFLFLFSFSFFLSKIKKVSDSWNPLSSSLLLITDSNSLIQRRRKKNELIL